MVVHRVPRGPRHDAGPRRRPADLDERAGLVRDHPKCPTDSSQNAGVTRDQQALFLTHAYACLANDPYVQNASWFSLQDFDKTETLGYRYGLYDFNGAPAPSLAAFQRAGSLGPDSGCGLPVDRASAGITIAWPTNNKNISADLRYNISATDAQGIRTLTSTSTASAFASRAPAR